MPTTKQRLERTMQAAQDAIFRGEDATGWLWLYELSALKLKQLAHNKTPTESAAGVKVLNAVINTFSISPKEGIRHA